MSKEYQQQLVQRSMSQRNAIDDLLDALKYANTQCPLPAQSFVLMEEHDHYRSEQPSKIPELTK